MQSLLRRVLALGVVFAGAFLGHGAETGAGPTGNRALAERIVADRELDDVLARARKLLGSGLNAGDGYGEVWIRDLNTFIELALDGNDSKRIRDALLTFFKFQGPTGDIVDGYIPAAKASVGYKYRRSASAEGWLAHKNTVETDQESSLIQAISRYVRVTGDAGILDEDVDGQRVYERLGRAIDYLFNERFDKAHGLIWGATTADWGDVQPEHEWGVELDEHSHRAIDIYDNALLVVALRAMAQLPVPPGRPPGVGRWLVRAEELRAAMRRHLWDARRGKFVPHVYLQGSPFPAEFDEAAVWYHGGTAVAIEAGVLESAEIRSSLVAMRDNVKRAGAASIGLTVYPPYPDGFFRNKGMAAWSYQNGGDWCWFGGRMVRELARNGLVEEAYTELKPMVSRVVRHDGFYEWWTRENQPRGSGQFRGSAGVLGQAIVELRKWAKAELAAAGNAEPRPPGIVVAHSPASSRQYLGSPSIVRLASGEWLISHDFFGPGSTADVVHVYGSTDGGATWQRRAEIRGAFWSGLFEHRGAVYLLGTSRQDGFVVVRRSKDAGRTWTEPKDGHTGLLLGDAKYHCAPVPVVEHDGRLWRAFEDTMGPGRWGSYFRSFMLSVPVEADLLEAGNWVASERLGRDPAWLGGRFGGWLEGNAVVTPEGRLINLLRADFRDPDEHAARIEIGADGRTGRFDPAAGFVRFPGGCKKFVVRRDPRDGNYWALSNPVPPSQVGGNVERTRNTLVLLSSRDLKTWEMRGVLLHHPDAERHGFQYPDWQFDGDDLVAAVRTAFDDEAGGAHNCHDANFVTFHRWPRFRALTPSTAPYRP